MPVLHVHLVEGRHSEAQCERLLEECSRRYAEVLKSPISRVRVFIHLHRPTLLAVGGVSLARGGEGAPYFEFLVLQGRSTQEKQALLSGFTDLIVDILGAEREAVRGACWPIPPEDWAIGGVPASVQRAAEVQARAAQSLAAQNPV